jgi:hypothetical protein
MAEIEYSGPDDPGKMPRLFVVKAKTNEEIKDPTEFGFGWNPKMGAAFGGKTCIVGRMAKDTPSLTADYPTDPTIYLMFFHAPGSDLTAAECSQLNADWSLGCDMFHFIEELKPAAEPEEEEPFVVPLKTPAAEPDVEALVQELISAWRTLDTGELEVFCADMHEKVARAIVTAAIEKRHHLPLDKHLRMQMDYEVTQKELLASNPNLRELAVNYLDKWLKDAGFSDLNYATNTCKTSKGQDTKLTRALTQCMPNPIPQRALEYCRALGVTKNLPTREGFVGLIGAACKSKASLTITANPADFVTSSNGGGFSSCHSAGGQHFAGNVGLSRTPATYMAFIGTPLKKTGRLWLYYDPETEQILQLKSYGVFPEDKRKAVREFFEDALVPGAVWVRRKQCSVNLVNKTGHSWGGYFDSNDKDLAFLKAKGYSSNFHVHYTKPVCVNCGTEREIDARTCLCGSCRSKIPRRMKCSCGKHLPAEIGEHHYVYRDSHYCAACWARNFVSCAHCDGMHLKSRMRTLRKADGASVLICSDCIDEHGDELFHYCRSCSTYHETPLLEVMRGRRVCQSCRDAHYRLCEGCGKYHYRPDINSVTGVCAHCTTENYIRCRECGKYRPRKQKTCECKQAPALAAKEKLTDEDIDGLLQQVTTGGAYNAAYTVSFSAPEDK